MLETTKHITRTLSLRLSLMVVGAIAVLLTASLVVMLYYSRKAVKEEAVQKAEKTLEATIQHIDNILLSVEQAAGNMYFNIVPHLDQPDRMFTFSRELVKSTPYIAGCAIALKPYYYKDREYFMAYVHRTGSGTESDSLATDDSPIIQAETFGNCPYTEQVWYTVPMQSSKPTWLDPLKGMEDQDIAPLTTFSLPLPGDDGKPIGVLGVDVLLSQLSRIVLAAKPSPNSYCTLLGSDGSFIVHPDTAKLFHQNVFTQTERDTDPSVKEAAKAMTSGQTGYKPFRLRGKDYYVFYKPFKRVAVPGRSIEELGWSVGIIYPEEDIYGNYRRLLYLVLGISVVGLLLLLLLCRAFTHRQLMPLRLLTRSAQRIADGHYDEPIPISHQKDEIGLLQNNFKRMQESLASHVSELEQMTTNLQERGAGLRAIYERAQEADRIKTTFLHKMTNQMIAPASSIEANVNSLCNQGDETQQGNVGNLVEDIQQQGKTITELLNNLLDMSDDRIKEGGEA